MQTVAKFLTNNLWAVTVQLVGLLVLLANLWLMSQLSPLAQDIALTDQRVDAHELRLTTTEQAIKIMSDDVTQVKTDTSYIRGFLEGK